MTARGHFGMSESGKSWAWKRLVEARARDGGPTIVFDRIHEWVRRDGYTELSVPVSHASTDEGLAAWVKERPTHVLVFKPPDVFSSEVGSSSEGSLTRTAEVLARTCLDIGAVFVSAEAHRVARNGRPLPTLLDELAGAGRHYGAAWWVDTQAFSLLSTRVRRQCTEVRVFTMAEPQELKALAAAYGQEMVDAVRECGRRMRNGEPGWFVNIDPWNAEPPWFLGRFNADASVHYEQWTGEETAAPAEAPPHGQPAQGPVQGSAEGERGGGGAPDPSGNPPPVD